MLEQAHCQRVTMETDYSRAHSQYTPQSLKLPPSCLGNCLRDWQHLKSSFLSFRMLPCWTGSVLLTWDCSPSRDGRIWFAVPVLLPWMLVTQTGKSLKWLWLLACSLTGCGNQDWMTHHWNHNICGYLHWPWTRLDLSTVSHGEGKISHGPTIPYCWIVGYWQIGEEDSLSSVVYLLMIPLGSSTQLQTINVRSLRG